ncbi:MAG: TonB-dependent receptor [Bryobacteraceae bacterium]
MKHLNLQFAAVLLLLAAITASAQEFRGSISGIVTDVSGAVVAGAKIKITSVERGISTDATSTELGRYTVLFLLPGTYRMTVEKSGFRNYVREGIVVAATDRIGIDVRLELGTITDSVTVTGQAPVLQTETASRTTVIDSRVVESVPAGTRNLFALQYTQAGVVKASTYWGQMGITAFGNVNSVVIGGGVEGENEAVMDGVTTTQSSRGVAYIAPLSSTQEVTIQTNSYDAQFGRVGGGVTLVNLKSGTNQLHGDLFWSHKNDDLMGMPWEYNYYGVDRSAVKYIENSFGVELDGPIYIPKIFDGRNRAFFMLSYEGMRTRQTGGVVTTLPLPAQLNGDFSGLYTDAGQQVTIYDPSSTALSSSGKYLRTPYSGNTIPSSLINPVAAKVVSFYPSPTSSGVGLSHSYNYTNYDPNEGSLNAWMGKMDFLLSERSRLAFRYGQTEDVYWEDRYWGDNAAEPSGEWPGKRVPRNWGADWTYTLSPTLVFNLRGGLTRYESFEGNSFGKGFDPRDVGFPDSLVSQFTTIQFPRFTVDGYCSLGASSVTNYTTHDSWSIQPNASYTRGRHFLKFGAEFRRYNDNAIQPGAASGTYAFSRTWTQQNATQSDKLSGNSVASLLLGNPASGSVYNTIDPSYSNFYYALYLHDDLKLTSKLTLNIGLRWDYETPRRERYDRMVRGFAFGEASPLASSVSGLDLEGGLIFAGVNGESRYAFDTYKTNFQPRVGIAYQFLPKWVLRGGWGLSYLGQSSNGPTTGFSATTSLTSTLDGGLTPAVSLSDPYPSSIYPSGLNEPTGSSEGSSTYLGQDISFQFVNRKLPYSHQFSLGVQHELPGQWLIDVSYIGNFTRRRPVSVGLNFIPRSTLESITTDQRASYFTTKVQNPMAGLLSGSVLNAATLARYYLLYTYPQYTSVTATDVPIGKQRYNSLQIKAQHRFSKGLSLTASYSISKSIEETATLNAQDVNLSNLRDTKLERVLTEFDVPQKLAVVGSFDLPFGRKRRFLSNLHPVLNGIIGGWTLSGEWVVQSGFPFTFANAAPLTATSAKLTNEQRDAAARAAGREKFDPVQDTWFDTSIFPTTALGSYILRTFPTRFPDVRCMALHVGDYSLSKDFTLKERLRLRVRIDAQNAFNHPWLSELRSYKVTSSSFGKLALEQTNAPRMVIGVLKLTF